MLKDRESYNAYMRTYTLNRYHKKRLELIAQLGGKCAKCGSTEDLEFDHVGPKTKEFTFSKTRYCEERQQQEALKCQLLCKPCHKDKHRSHPVCGTNAKYCKGCKCGLCKRAHTLICRRKKLASLEGHQFLIERKA